MKVKSITDAWIEITRMLANGYTKDEKSSEVAGYTIYRSNTNFYDYVCDLGDRLEVNTCNGKTINIWIEKPVEEEKEEVITEYQILKYAYDSLIMKWAKEKDILEKNPDFPIAKSRERKYWEQLQEIGNRILKIENDMK